jgi:aminoglycoside phosphotransferase (APT) family kinase protein
VTSNRSIASCYSRGLVSAQLSDAVVEWALAAVGGDHLVSTRGLRADGPPWLLSYEASGTERKVVLRVGPPDAAGEQEREVCGIELARGAGIPVAGVIARGAAGQATVLLIEYVDGTSVQPLQPDNARLAALGRIAARIGAVDPGSADLPGVTHPIDGEDFDGMRARTPQPLLIAAQERIATIAPDDPIGFVHGDLWSGNTLWRGAELAAVIDWDCAGLGAAGVDLGRLRCDAAMCYGLNASDQVLNGWETEAGRPAESVAYWDAVAALSTPPDIDWFVEGIAGMTGRPDLTKEVLRARRDAFLANALDRIV